MADPKGWIDISVPLKTGMIHYPGDPPFQIERIKEIGRDSSSTLSRITMGAHSGTHVDAPLHFLENGVSIDRLPFDAFIGTARIIGVRDRESIKTDELKEHRIDRGDIVLFKTRNSELWQYDRFFKDFVYLSEPAALYLVEKGVKTVGIDYLSIAGIEVHRILLDACIPVIEGLDLTPVAPGPYRIICLPLLIEGGEGAPARVVVKPLDTKD
jgi:arylformamidase